jgi:stage V sporulation protein T
MRATGVVRRIDDLGRVVIPKEIRRSMGIKEGDPLEMFIDTESGGLVLVAYHSEASDKINAIAENLSTVGATPDHWVIAEQLRKIAKKLEKLQ